MAKVMRLADVSAGVTYDFLTGTLYPLIETWTTSPARQDGTVTESMTLACRGQTDAAIMAAVQTISEMKRTVKLFWENPFETDDSIWFEVSTTSETAKRALVYSIDLRPDPRSKFNPMLGYNTVFYNLTIIRDEVWEDRAVTTALLAATAIDCIGGTISVDACLGDTNARILSALIKCVTASVTVETVYMGIRPKGPGKTGFKALWECESGTLGTDASLVTDAWASPGGSNNAVKVSFATATLVKRLSMVLSTFVTSNYSHQMGEYYILLRYKITDADASSVFGVQMRTGFSNSDTAARQEVFIDEADSARQDIINLGKVVVPPMGYRINFDTGYSAQNFLIELYVERISGTSTIELDCVIFMPAKHFIYFTGADMVQSGEAICVLSSEDDRFIIAKYQSATVQTITGVLPGSIDNWEFPIDGGTVVIACPNEAYTTDMNITLDGVLRHKHYRES